MMKPPKLIGCNAAELYSHPHYYAILSVICISLCSAMRIILLSLTLSGCVCVFFCSHSNVCFLSDKQNTEDKTENEKTNAKYAYIWMHISNGKILFCERKIVMWMALSFGSFISMHLNVVYRLIFAHDGKSSKEIWLRRFTYSFCCPLIFLTRTGSFSVSFSITPDSLVTWTELRRKFDAISHVFMFDFSTFLWLSLTPFSLQTLDE